MYCPLPSVSGYSSETFIGKNELRSFFSPIFLTDIKDTPSYSQYQGEIEEGETYIGVFSGLFLFIALLSVNTRKGQVLSCPLPLNVFFHSNVYISYQIHMDKDHLDIP